MSDNPLIEGFLKLHEAGGIGGGMSGTKFSKAANYAPAVGAGVRGAVDNVTMGTGKYARAATDYAVKNLGSAAGMSEPTTFDKELEQEREKDQAAQKDHPTAWDIGDKAATAAQVASGVGAVKALGTAAIKAGTRATLRAGERSAALAALPKSGTYGGGNLVADTAAAKKAAADLKYRSMAMSNAELTNAIKTSKTPELTRELERRLAIEKMPNLPVVNDFKLGAQNTLNLTPQMRVPPTPLKLTPNQMIPKSSKIIPFPKNTKLTTEDQNESSKGNTEMSINPFIKGFFDIEEARAKNTNIFDESKKLTAAQKENLDKNDNDKIDAEDFKMLRKEEAIEEAKKNNAMVMARNISKVLKAAKPDFLDIDKDGDKEEPMKKAAADMKKENAIDEAQSMSGALKNALSKPEPGSKLHRNIQAHNNSIKNGSKLGDDNHNLMTKAPSGHRFDKKGMIRLGEEVEFSEEEIDFINSVMEAMPVAPTSENDSPNPTPKKKAEGSRAKGSMAD
jgi:hypothetical protein